MKKHKVFQFESKYGGLGHVVEGTLYWWLWRRVQNERKLAERKRKDGKKLSRIKFPQRNAKRLRIIINDLK